MRGRLDASRGLAAFLAAAGLNHFLMPRFYDAMIPEPLPGSARSWTYGSGIAELAVAAAVAGRRTRRAGALAAAALFVTVLPGNVKMASDAFRRHRPMRERVVLLLRLPVQFPLIRWALNVSREQAHGTIAG
ncbi:MAG TPA: hypothetical protein VGN35_05240 [Jatrophihabitantaceae bacterium]|jgi:uncharacterized membrane protein|nr:hypothetical protein [Jatrophihabitantaceae bacterium]